MHIVALISCTSRKRHYPCEARLMYDPSALFRTSYEYAKLVSAEQYILSAKYGVVRMNETIEPYDMTLKDFNSKEKKRWAEMVLSRLAEYSDIRSTRFIILAGQAYYLPLIRALEHYELPLAHITQGRRINVLKGKMKKVPQPSLCAELHAFFNALPRYDFSSIKDIGYKNGIYVMFEKGEKFGDFDRIVRVGINKEQDRLQKRLRQHFRYSSLKSSVFRRNIAQAILAVSTESEPLSLKGLQKNVTEYIQKNISFTTIPVFNKDDRSKLENGIIAALHQDPDFGSQENWRGRLSPVDAVRKSGMWLTKGLTAAPLTRDEFRNIQDGAYAGIHIPPNKVSQKRPSKARAEKKEVRVVKNIEKGQKVPGVSEIESYLYTVLEDAAKKGDASVEIVSGDIHRAMGLRNRMPSVCNAMRKIAGYPLEIMHETPSGNSSTLRIKYLLKSRQE